MLKAVRKKVKKSLKNNLHRSEKHVELCTMLMTQKARWQVPDEAMGDWKKINVFDIYVDT